VRIVFKPAQRRMKATAAIPALLVATFCGPAMPQHAPQKPVSRQSLDIRSSQQPIERYAASLAGSGAIDCGVGSDRTSDRRVYDCGQRLVSGDRPFFCRYEPWPSLHGDVITEEYELPAVAFAYNRARTLFLIQPKATGQFQALPVVQAGSSGAPTRMLRGTRPPGLRSNQAGTIPIQGPHPTGVVIVEVIICSDGAIPDAQILKPLSQSIDREILETLPKLKIEQARLFGLPVSIIYNIGVYVREGHLEFHIGVT